MKKVLIIGGGELTRQINHYITHFDSGAEVTGYVDDTIPAGTIRFNLTSLGSLNDISKLHSEGKFDHLIIGIGYKHLEAKKTIFERFVNDYSFYNFIHPDSYLDRTATIGRGVIIGPKVVVEQRTVIEDDVFIYNSASVAHDSKIGAHSFLTPNVAIAGFVSVGLCCRIGINATIIDNINIADYVQLGGGTVVVRNIEKSGLYVGNPAKFIR